VNKSKISYRLIVFVAALFFGIVYSIPSFFNTVGSKISLGLDLQGGMHMLLGVRSNEAVEAKIKSLSSSINYFCETNDILVDEFDFNEESISFELLDIDAKAKLEEFLNDIKGITLSKEKTKDSISYSISLTPQEIKKTKEFAVLQSVETIRNRLDQFGLSEPTVAKHGKDKILVELPGVKTPQEEQRARKLIGKTAHLEMMSVDEKNANKVYALSDEEIKELGDVRLSDKNDPNKLYLLHQIPILDGKMLTDAKVGYDRNNQPVINFSLDSEGGKIFGDFTAKNVGNRLAIVLDGKVYSAPVIRERIGGGSGQISGNFSVAEAHDLAIALRSGALSASVEMLEKRSIGPSLGKDSIRDSAIALVSGFLLVALFMIYYYRFSGIVSDIALVANLFIIIAIMSLFGATLTLPGMVGIVLTVGMAVDANVIINERIKELLYEGKSITKAIEQGYENAMSAILDANITTLIAAVALYAYGTGPIKGFAITLSIGILASMLTAILGTHGMYEYMMSKMAKDKNVALRWFGLDKAKG